MPQRLGGSDTGCCPNGSRRPIARRIDGPLARYEFLGSLSMSALIAQRHAKIAREPLVGLMIFSVASSFSS